MMSVSLLRSQIRQSCLVSPLLPNITEVLASARRQINAVTIRKEDIKLSLSVDSIIYIKKPIEVLKFIMIQKGNWQGNLIFKDQYVKSNCISIYNTQMDNNFQQYNFLKYQKQQVLTNISSKRYLSHGENYMTMKEIKEDLSKWSIPYSWIGRVNFAKISIHPYLSILNSQIQGNLKAYLNRYFK